MGVDSGGLYSNAVSASLDKPRGARSWYFCGMPEKPRPSLLNELRQRSAAIREQRDAARLPEEKAQHAIEEALWRVFRWLEEAMGHLETIRPEVQHRFRLDDFLTFDGLQIDNGFAVFRRHGLGVDDRLEHVEMFYELAASEPALVKVKPLAALGVEERLRGAALQFQIDNEVDEFKVVRSTLFRIQPTIRASVQFKPHYKRRAIDVLLRNVDRFESVQLEFDPARIDEPALEDLVRLVLGESDAFLHRAPLAYVNAKK